MTSSYNTSKWISRVLKDMGDVEKKTTKEIVAALEEVIDDIPDEFALDIASKIYRYALRKREKNRYEENEVGDIQNAYNRVHEMLNDLVNTETLLEHFYKNPKTAFEVDKWGWMLVHHAVVKRADVKFIEAVAIENPEALYVCVGATEQTPIQLAARFSSPISVIKALYNAAPSAITVKAPNGDSPHILACRGGADIEVRAFLYSNRDGPIPYDKKDEEEDYSDMPGLIPVTPPSEPEEEEEEEEQEQESGEDENTPHLPLELEEEENKDFIVEYVRSVGLREAYPVMFVLLAWIFMLTIALLSGTRTAV
jgi:hypothetical protein